MSATAEQPKVLRFPPVPARCVNDFKIPDEAIHADGELSKRMDECAMELVRLSLAGIAGYGFLIKEVILGSARIMLTNLSGLLLFGGASCFAAALALAFRARELQVRCSGIQIAILRTFGKIENGGWCDDQVETLKKSVDLYRAEQEDKLEGNRKCMRMAHILLFFGAACAVLCFGVALWRVHPSQDTKTATAVSQPIVSPGLPAAKD